MEKHIWLTRQSKEFMNKLDTSFLFINQKTGKETAGNFKFSNNATILLAKNTQD